MRSDLIQKYNIPGPRYTSYPTVPFWDAEDIAMADWIKTLRKAFNESNQEEGISLYIHMPYCESLCTFCACHKHITKRHSVEEPYITTVLKEWQLYCDILDVKPRIKEIHLGGGTPTFFSPQQLTRLIDGIFKRAEKSENYSFSFEGHPNNTTEEHLQTLYDLGFKRNSFGVQDYDPVVQKAIHRIQPFEVVERVTSASRRIGYDSVSHDLVFGLPFQTENSIRNTIQTTIRIKPDRIAYYSYAHVPWIKGVGQRGFDENDLPKDSQKRFLYELGKQLFFDNGYEEIGMDHFALPSDSLYKAIGTGTLHRNFMGYTAEKTKLMIGLGASSISDSWYSFVQNEKNIDDYTHKVEQGELPVFRGHLLNASDLVIRRHILNIMCQLQTSWEDPKLYVDEIPEVVNRLAEIEKDGLIEIDGFSLRVKQEGRMFLRNICMAFDLRLIENKPATRIFSMTI